ncbi:MAG: hypothetical protein NXI24_24955 [bacterium]|nr:hypothetical protein [bacterium]
MAALRIGAVLLPVLLLWSSADSSAQDRRESEFVPGSSSIEEREILRRMERELGQEFTPRASRSTVTKRQTDPKRKKTNGPPRFNVTLVTGRDQRIAGRIALTQTALELTEDQNGVAVRHRIPVPEIGQIEFLDWRAVRLHREPGGEARRVLYFPTRCRLTRKDQTQLEGAFAAFDWLEFRMQSGLSFGSYRTYFSVDPNNPEGPASAANSADAAADPDAETSAADASAPDGDAAADNGNEAAPAAENPTADSNSGKTPENLAEWNQRGPARVPPGIVRTIVFGDGTGPGDANTDAGKMDANDSVEKSERSEEEPTAGDDEDGDSIEN